MKQQYCGANAGLVAALPIVIGYFPVAMAFGLLAKTVNISLWDTCLFSLIVFAGASQFMALDLIKAGIAAGDIILATFLLNLRHLMMSASLAVRCENVKRGWLPFIAFGITDETFSVASLQNGKLSARFLLTLQVLAYAAWVSGTLAGYLVGAALPAAVQSSLGIGLYAMFTAILVPEIKRSANVLYLAAMSGIVYIISDTFQLLPAGWGLIVSIIMASAAGLFILKDDTKEEAI